jgi:hypothetical protein
MKIKNILLFLVLMITLVVDAQAQSTISGMFASGTKTFVSMIKIIQYASYAIGAFLIVGAIFKLPQLSDPQARVSPKTPLIMFFVGIAIFTLTGSVAVMSNTMSMGSGPGDALLQGPNTGGVGAMAAAITGVLTFIRMIGYIAFIRGWLMLNQAGQGKDGIVGRGLTHIGGGIACINVKATAYMLAATFAPGMPLAQYLN